MFSNCVAQIHLLSLIEYVLSRLLDGKLRELTGLPGNRPSSETEAHCERADLNEDLGFHTKDLHLTSLRINRGKLG